VILKWRGTALFGPDGKEVISAGESIIRNRRRSGLRGADGGDEPGDGDVQPEVAAAVPTRLAARGGISP